MAVFQKSVSINPGEALPGAFASINPAISTPIAYKASGDVAIGAFFWADEEGLATTSGTGAPDGFVHRDMIYSMAAKDGAIDVVPDGAPVDGFTAGDFWAVAAEGATKGQKVFASTTDGTLKAGEAGGSVDGAVETGMYYVTSAEEGELAIISGTVKNG